MSIPPSSQRRKTLLVTFGLLLTVLLVAVATKGGVSLFRADLGSSGVVVSADAMSKMGDDPNNLLLRVESLPTDAATSLYYSLDCPEQVFCEGEIRIPSVDEAVAMKQLRLGGRFVFCDPYMPSMPWTCTLTAKAWSVGDVRTLLGTSAPVNVDFRGGDGPLACGDEKLQKTEECDDGEKVDGDGCSSTCKVEPGYYCYNPKDAFTGVVLMSSCSHECGDGRINRLEECDDGNTMNGDGCSSICMHEKGFICDCNGCRPVCGDSIVAPGEQCDDGNHRSGDGCSSICQVEAGYRCPGGKYCEDAVCGDGIVGYGLIPVGSSVKSDICDDNNLNNRDGCSPLCVADPGYICTGSPSVCVNSCGNGQIDPGEQCDDGGAVDSDGCDRRCQREMNLACGNGSVDRNLGEECDDRNLTSGDGCSATCVVEKGYACSQAGGEGSCTKLCSNGVIDADEECDDANGADGDGCSSTCEVEPGMRCTGVTSKCVMACGDCNMVHYWGQGHEDKEQQCDAGWPGGVYGLPGEGLEVMQCTCSEGLPKQTQSCNPSLCGNGGIDSCEECDDANKVDGDGCSSTCKVEGGSMCLATKTGVRWMSECTSCQTTTAVTDRGLVSVASGFDCPGVLKPDALGGTFPNGRIDPGEECDDGNINDGDGCSKQGRREPGFMCTCDGCTPVCGDGLKRGKEQCDDGNRRDFDGCSSDCTVERGWVCDPATNLCRKDMTCGDGIVPVSVSRFEMCDDGNTKEDDGCSPDCKPERGFVCQGSPSVCVQSCGNGIVDPGEECDDRNGTAGDGCSPICGGESGWSCYEPWMISPYVDKNPGKYTDIRALLYNRSADELYIATKSGNGVFAGSTLADGVDYTPWLPPGGMVTSMVEGDGRLFVSRVGGGEVYQLDLNGHIVGSVIDHFAAGAKALAYDPNRHRLFAAVGIQVLVYDTIGHERMTVVYALGTPEKYLWPYSAMHATTIVDPVGLAFDPKTDALFVADGSTFRRILVFDASHLQNRMAASRVLGRELLEMFIPPAWMENATPIHPGDAWCQNLSICSHYYDPVSKMWWRYDFSPSPITKRTVNARNFGVISSLAFDPKRQLLFVGDSGNERIMVFNVVTVTNNMPAATILGQPDASSYGGGKSSQKFHGPTALAFDQYAWRLFVGDSINHRVLVFDAFNNYRAASMVLGQTSMEATLDRQLPSICQETCGNRKVDYAIVWPPPYPPYDPSSPNVEGYDPAQPQPPQSEYCDDGNTISGDGCSSTCQPDFSQEKMGCSRYMQLVNENISQSSEPESYQYYHDHYPDIYPDADPQLLLDPAKYCDASQAREGCSEDCTVLPGWNCNFGDCTRIPNDCSTLAFNGPLAFQVEQCDDGNTTGGDGCTSNRIDRQMSELPPAYVCQGTTCATICGDGQRMGAEECDNGPNNTVGDGCDGCKITTGWTCTDLVCPFPGINFECTGIPNQCFRCGDGIIDPGQECDDKNTVDGDGCSSSCKIEPGYICYSTPSNCHVGCSNGIIEEGEGCDDGNLVNGDGCSDTCYQERDWTCTPDLWNLKQQGGELPYLSPSVCQLCANGKIEGTEVCDAGAEGSVWVSTGTSYYGYSEGYYDGPCYACKIVRPGWTCRGGPGEKSICMKCGNGKIEDTETCDDGNAWGDDGCSATCLVEYDWSCKGEPSVCKQQCGNGVVDPLETCDDGNTAFGDGCSNTCHKETGWTCDREPSVCQQCGNGIREGTEACDDGKVTDDDGCSAACQIEQDWTCLGTKSVCQKCGNGTLEGVEACDDSNKNGADGCSATCQVEPGWTCPKGPGACQKCGNGIVEGTETCDDKNSVNGDGCNVSCEIEPALPSGAIWRCSGNPSICEMCGNGNVEGTETCDDGGWTNGDGCTSSCQIESGWTCMGNPSRCNKCGDGIRQLTEACDDGNTNPNDGCSADCSVVESGWTCMRTLPGSPDYCAICGDGKRDSGQQCDDGNLVDGDGCTSYCTVEDGWACSNAPMEESVCSKCGNREIEGNEQCDDGNKADGDGCGRYCTIEGSWTCNGTNPTVCQKCQNGKIEGTEECDDGNAMDGDGCSVSCRLEPGYTCANFLNSCRNCGNGKRDPGELCDDGNTISGDGCTDNCTTIETATGWTCTDRFGEKSVCQNCGDRVKEGGETCDDGNTTPGDGCSPACQTESGWSCWGIPSSCYRCGNGIIDPGEQCDSGGSNGAGNYGCTSSCQITPGWTCTGQPSLCTQIRCGNNIIQPGEACDDGNETPGDGCSPACAVEPDWTCNGMPSVCQKCGNRSVEEMEQCDDGNTKNGDGCSSVCEREAGWFCDDPSVGFPSTCFECGNGKKERTEWCDDGNRTDGDGCSARCQIEPGASCYGTTPSICSICGNRTREGMESCDDGNTTMNDGCWRCNVEGGWLCNDSSPSVCARSCGNKLLDPGEVCDDGNRVSGDGCNAYCNLVEAGFTCTGTPSVCEKCRNGIVEGTEQCDDGNPDSGDGCSIVCKLEAGWTCSGKTPSICNKCGNGIVDGSETCDDGNTTDGDGCSPLCRVEDGFTCSGTPSVCQKCGNSRIEGTEDCDDGNTKSGDGCNADCTSVEFRDGWTCTPVAADLRSVHALPYLAPSVCKKCGNGTMEADEQCDDGTIAGGDGCWACKVEDDWSCTGTAPSVCVQCGNGKVEGTEQCDDGNANNFDGCISCTVSPGWICDRRLSGDLPESVCHMCGNGQKEGSETCDDGNLKDGDGCSATCAIEGGWTCSISLPSKCNKCGNGIVETYAENCDDGNTRPGDGCSASCTVETAVGWSCNGASPSVCQKCGNGIKEGTEACDDGNENSRDGCLACTVENGWACTGSRSVCHQVVCGDGKKEGSEVCDDGNTVNGDGCRGSCSLIEAGWICSTVTGQKSICQKCGNGMTEGTETCDDQNTISTDGCNLCQVMPGWMCTGSPSQCSRDLRELVRQLMKIGPTDIPTLRQRMSFFSATLLAEKTQDLQYDVNWSGTVNRADTRLLLTALRLIMGR